MPAPPSIIPLTEALLPSLCTLYAQVWKTPMDAAYFRWMFLEHPLHGRYPMPLVAVRNGEVIGTLGGMPVDMQVDGQRLQSYQFSNAMVYPEYAGKGLFNQIYQEYLNIFTSHHVDLLWGFGNRLACNYFYRHEPRTVRLGNSPLQIRPLDTLPFLEKRVGSVANVIAPCLNAGLRCMETLFYPTPNPLADITNTDWPELIDPALNIPASPIYLLKNSAWYQWRYRGYTESHYRVLHCRKTNTMAIVRPEPKEKRLLVMDVLNYQGNSKYYQRLMHNLLHYARCQGFASIHCWGIPESFSARICKKNGFLYHPEKRNFFIAANLSGAVHSERLFLIRDWELTLGDGDRA